MCVVAMTLYFNNTKELNLNYRIRTNYSISTNQFYMNYLLK